jgi:hypothetical protein
MALPCRGDTVTFYLPGGRSIPARVQSVDDIAAKLMVAYLDPSGNQAVITTPWSAQGSDVGQWEPIT